MGVGVWEVCLCVYMYRCMYRCIYVCGLVFWVFVGSWKCLSDLSWLFNKCVCVVDEGFCLFCF